MKKEKKMILLYFQLMFACLILCILRMLYIYLFIFKFLNHFKDLFYFLCRMQKYFYLKNSMKNLLAIYAAKHMCLNGLQTVLIRYWYFYLLEFFEWKCQRILLNTRIFWVFFLSLLFFLEYLLVMEIYFCLYVILKNDAFALLRYKMYSWQNFVC